MKMKTKTTTKDFLLFKKRCLFYLALYNLRHYDTTFEHDVLWSKTGGGLLGGCTASIDAKHSILFLGKTWGEYDQVSNERIDEIAHHEVLELFLSEIMEVAKARKWDEVHADGVKHTIIQTLLNVYKGK